MLHRMHHGCAIECLTENSTYWFQQARDTVGTKLRRLFWVLGLPWKALDYTFDLFDSSYFALLEKLKTRAVLVWERATFFMPEKVQKMFTVDPAAQHLARIREIAEVGLGAVVD